MTKWQIFKAILFFFPVAAFAQTPLKIMATCAAQIDDPAFMEDPVITPPGFVRYLSEKLHSPQIRLVSEFNLPGEITVAGKSQYVSTRKAFVVEIPDEALLDHLIAEREAVKKDPEKYRYYRPSQNITEVLYHLAGGALFGQCELLVPTRYSVLFARELQELNRK